MESKCWCETKLNFPKEEELFLMIGIQQKDKEKKIF